MPVVLELKAKMKCDHSGCKAETPVELALLSNGTLGFRPINSAAGKAWKVGVQPPNGPYVARCAEHMDVVETVRPKIELVNH